MAGQTAGRIARRAPFFLFFFWYFFWGVFLGGRAPKIAAPRSGPFAVVSRPRSVRTAIARPGGHRRGAIPKSHPENNKFGGNCGAFKKKTQAGENARASPRGLDTRQNPGRMRRSIETTSRTRSGLGQVPMQARVGRRVPW